MLELLVVALLVLLNGFFAMSEMAVVTSRKLRLKQMAETSRGAQRALQLAEHPDSLLSTVQICITLIGVLAGLFGGQSLGLLVGDALAHAGIEPGLARRVGIAVAVGLITAASVIFGELVPKRMALTNPERIAAAVAIPLATLSRLMYPVVVGLGAINRGVLRLLGVRDDTRSGVSEEEIRMLVSESHEQGVIDADERKMMNRVLSLGDRSTESLMTPRMRIVWLDAAAEPAENLETLHAAPFSRFPVYRGNDQDVLGVLEAKTLLRRMGRGDPVDLFAELSEPLFVSESTPAMKLLEIFREEQQSLALVVDEYGDVTGLVTVNDLMGAVIGRIQTDRDEGPANVVTREDGSLLVDGSLAVDELRDLLGTSGLPGEDEHDFHTAAGMVIVQFGRIPHPGEYFEWGGWRIEVVDLDGPRVDKLMLQRLAVTDADDARPD
ncbi:MAG TPA: hemolysin family protein [Lysobacter sp.]